MSRIKYILIGILGISSFLIVCYNFYVADSLKYEFQADATDFIHLGLTLAKTGKYGHFNLSREQMLEAFKKGDYNNKGYNFSGYSTWRPPVWPIIIAISFLVSGYSIGFLLIVKFLIHLLGAYLFYRILKCIEVSYLWVCIGVFLYLVSPAWQLYSRVFLSEPITLFLMTFFIWSLFKYLKSGKWIWLNGLAGGILILSHPYYIFFPFSIWFFLFLNNKIKLKNTLVLGILAAVIVSLWILRNSIVMDTSKLLITSSSGAVMAKGWNEKVPELHTNTKGDRAEEDLVLENFEYSKLDYRGRIGLMELYQDATYEFIRSNPDLILPIIGKKIKSAINPFPETPRPGILETGRVLYQFFGLVASIFLLWWGSNTIRALVLGLFLSTFLITIITFSGFRFRMPQSALEILFVVYAFNLLKEKFKLRYSIS